MAKGRPSVFVAPVRFLNREAHEAALDQTDAVGPCFPDHADLIPPLPHPAAVMAGAAGLAMLGTPPASNLSSFWAALPMPSVRVDGRAPHRADIFHEEAAEVPRGFVLIGPDLSDRVSGTFARLLFRAGGRETFHRLVRAGSGNPVLFDGWQKAKDALGPSILAGGVPPAGMRWDGCPELGSPWQPGKGSYGGAEAMFAGRHKWTLRATASGFTVTCNRTRHPEPFASIEAAKQFITHEDAK